MSSGISKFGYSENTSVGMIGPRGLPGKDGIDGKNGTDGKDAVFSFTENMNANDKNITNLNTLDVKNITRSDGQQLNINSVVNMNGYGFANVGGQIFQNGFTINGSYEVEANKFLKTDEGTTLTSADIQINDVKDLSTRLLLNESNTQNITLINTGDPFTPPNQGASLIQSTSANPTFKIKGLTSSNSIFLTPSTNSVDVSIDPALTTRLSNVEAKSSNISISNYTGQPAFNQNIFLYLTRSDACEISPWAVLYRTYGFSALFDIRDGNTYVKVTNSQLPKGNKIIPVGGLYSSVLFKFTLGGLITSDAKVDMTFSIFSGATRLITYTVGGDGLNNQGFEFSSTVHLSNPVANSAYLQGIGKYEKDGKSPSFAVSTTINNLSILTPHTFDIHMKPASTMVNGSVNIFRYILETI